MVQPVRGKNQHIGYFLRGATHFARARTIGAIARFIMGIICASYDRSVAGIREAIADSPTASAMRQFLHSKELAAQLARILDWKTRQHIRKALRRSANRRGRIVLCIDSTFKGTLSALARNLFFPGPGKAKRTGNHIFVCGLLVFPDGRMLPLRPLQRKMKNAQTQVDLAQELVRILAPMLQGYEVVVVADSFFFAKKLIKTITRSGFHYVIACQGNTVVSDGWNFKSHVEDVRFQGLDVTLLSVRGERKKKFSVALEHLVLRTGGRQAVVFSRRHKKPGAEVKFLASDLLDATAVQIASLYAVRWQIELFFREAKMYLGLDQYRVGGEHGPENFAMLVTLAYQFLHWHGQGLGPRRTTLTCIKDLMHAIAADNILTIERAALTRHKRKQIREHYGIRTRKSARISRGPEKALMKRRLAS
jgi:hypothetical protein